MDLEITPEPEPDERAALVVALEDLLEADEQPEAYKSRWREAGIRESLDLEP